MTNPLEQIRELANNWQKSRNFSGGHLAHSILAILDASQGYVCVPVEPTEAMLEAALKLQGDDAFLARAPAVLSAFMKIYKAMLAASKDTNRE